MNKSIRVLFVDDDPRLRAAWTRLLEAQPDIELVGTLENADNLTETARRTEAKVVLLDLSMPGRDACDAIAELTRDFRDCRVIVYSGYNDRAVTQRAYDAGASDVVDKLDEPREIVQTIRRVAGNGGDAGE